MTMKPARGQLLFSLLGAAALIVACRRRDPVVKTWPADAPSGTADEAAPPSQGSAEPAATSQARRLPQSAEECGQACNGEWSAHGLAAVIGCLCRTRDFARDCRDGADCEGECLLDPVRSEVHSPGPPATGLFIGKCSEFVTAFGCVRRIPKGAKQRGPVDLSDLPAEICMD